jgi:UDP-N-acetylmuramoyl-L-alanyl-D-glutamate--2,6-diaminopimelate ligase
MSARFELPLIGEFQALNALAAAAICDVAGRWSSQAVAEGLSKLKPVKGRLELCRPDCETGARVRRLRPHAGRSRRAAARRASAHGRPPDRDVRLRRRSRRQARPIMGEIASRQADDVIVTDDNPRSEDPAKIRAAVLGGARGAREIGDRGEAIRTVIRELKKGDTLVIAGKGHETGQIVGKDVLPFSDQEEARAALAGSLA